MSLSLYRTKELGSGSRPSHSAAQYADHSFIALLGLAQRLQISFLPITWQVRLDNLGQGGQASIRQALVTVQTSFAFKRFRDELNGNVDEDTPFQAVINEMIMLSHRVIRDHLYVVTLEGICWDFPEDGDQIWPVLVFEKSIHGDLLQFTKEGCGSSLSTQEKLKLCTDIGIAIRDMHSNNIIHGDIKNENVLIFEDENHEFVAKMADFGFSIGFREENDKIFLPKSRPWNAPEYHGRHFSPEEAKRMDIYSFGLLCFWFLFGTSGQLPLPLCMQCDDVESISFEVDRERPTILECLKKNEDDDFLKWIVWIINRQDNLKDDERNNFEQFFRFTLAWKPDERNMNYDDLLSLLAPYRAIQPLMKEINKDMLLEEEYFEIRSSFLEFYEVDSRLRTYITACLLSISRESSTPLTRRISSQEAAFQLALCYKIGFGVPRDCNRAREFLEKSLQDWEDLEEEVSILKNANQMRLRKHGLFSQMENLGYIASIYSSRNYPERGAIEKAEYIYLREIRDIHQEFGDGHAVSIILKTSLANLYTSQGLWDKAEELEVQLLETTKRLLGPENAMTLNIMANLASTYCDQGHWNKAEELEVEVMETWTRLFGPDDNTTLLSIGNLAVTYLNQGSLDKAKELGVQVVEARCRIHGPEHLDTLTSIANIAVMYGDQGHWNKAEELSIQVVEARCRILGPEHLDTLMSQAYLMTIYARQGHWNKAEELGTQVVEARRRILGPEHLDTLMSMHRLTTTYGYLEQWEKAEELGIQVVDARRRILGPEHPDTLISIKTLAVIHDNWP